MSEVKNGGKDLAVDGGKKSGTWATVGAAAAAACTAVGGLDWALLDQPPRTDCFHRPCLWGGSGHYRRFPR